MRARLLAIGILCTLIAACDGAGSVARSGGSVLPTNVGRSQSILAGDAAPWKIFPLRHNAAPGSVAVGPRGKIWFTDDDPVSGVSKIGRIFEDGHADEFALQKDSDPQDIVEGPDGNMWFTEYSSSKVGRITPTGLVSEFSPPSSGQPIHITVGPDGALWFTEPSGGQVGRITTGGQITEFPVPAVGITTGPDSNLWVTTGHGTIDRMTTTGTVTEFKTHFDARPNDIVAGPDGKLWFVQWRPHTGYAIGRMTTTGVLKEYPLAGQIVTGLTSAYGNVWFTVMTSTGSGVASIDPHGVITEHLLQSQGVYDLVLAPDGNIWFSYGSAIGVYTP